MFDDLVLINIPPADLCLQRVNMTWGQDMEVSAEGAFY